MSSATKAAVSVTEAWVLGPLKTPFYTKTWSVERPERVVVFVHGFNEHITRYNHYFSLLAELTSSRIFAFDQRGFGHTAFTSPPADLTKGTTGTKRSKRGVTHTDQQRKDIEHFVRQQAKESRNGKVWVYGHSMGGALVLGIPTYAANTAGASTSGDAPLLSLLEGIVSSSPLIHQTSPAPKWQVSIGSSIASIGSIFANRHIPAPVEPTQLSRDPAKVEENKKDALCPQSASLSILGSMLLSGQALLTEGAPGNWPVDLPLLIVHGKADAVTDPAASASFHSALPSTHTKNKYISVPDGFHELHNEPSPVWEDLAQDVAEFITNHSGSTQAPQIMVSEPTATGVDGAVAHEQGSAKL